MLSVCVWATPCERACVYMGGTLFLGAQSIVHIVILLHIALSAYGYWATVCACACVIST